MAANFVAVNYVDTSVDAAGTTIAPASINVVTGNLLVAAMRWEGGGLNDTATATLTDTAGNTYINIGYTPTGSATEDEKVGVWYCLSATGNAANVTTGTLTDSRVFKALAVAQYSYTGTIELGDTGSGASATNVTPLTTSPALNAVVGDLVVGWFGHYNDNITFTADSPFVVQSSLNYGKFLDHIVSSSGTFTPGMTATSTGDTFGAVTAVFQEGDTVNHYDLPADQGSYSLSGQDAALSSSASPNTFTLTADQGSYSVNGSAALVDSEVTAAQGSFTITGFAAGLTKSYMLTAEPGAHLLVASDAGLLYSGGGPKLMVADQGVYNITGQGATLRRAAVSLANYGVYNLRGFSVVGGVAEDANTIAHIFRVRKVLVVSTTGRTKWVHYIPVQPVAVTAQNIGRFNEEGAVEVELIESGVGLVEWVDYIPVVETADSATGRWRYDNAGWIPIVYVD